MNRTPHIAATLAAALVLATVACATEENHRVAFVGDSLTCNTLVPPKELYPELVSRYLGNIAVQNLGRPGSTMSTFPGTVFHGWMDARGAVEAVSGCFPLSAVVVLVGTNDWVLGQDAIVVETAYRLFLTAIHTDTKVLCVTPPWRRDEGTPNRIGETLDDVRAAIKRACAPRGAVLDGVNLIPHNPRYFLDLVHPNAAGNRRLARAVAKALAPLLEVSPPGPGRSAPMRNNALN